MHRENRDQLRGFLLAFTLTLTLLSLVMVITVMAVQPSMPKSRRQERREEPAWRPQAEDSLTLAVVGTQGGEPADVLLIRFNPQYGQVPLCLLPPGTLVEPEEGGSATLAQVYRAGGGAAVKGALSRRLGVEVDRYAVLSRDLFLRLAEKTGSVEFELPYEIAYQRDGFSVSIPAGVRRLDGRDIADVLGYPHFPDAEERSKVLGDLIAAIINQNLDVASDARSSTVFKLAVNLLDTDVNAADYEQRRQAADFLSQVDAQVAGNRPAAGAPLGEDAFQLSENCVDLLREYFQASG